MIVYHASKKGFINDVFNGTIADDIDHAFLLHLWGIERSGFFNGREKWAKGFENQRV